MTVVPVTPAAAAGAEQKYRRPSGWVLDLGFKRNSLEDSSGKGNNGTLSSGEAEYVDGVVGKGLKIKSYVNLGNSTDSPAGKFILFVLDPSGFGYERRGADLQIRMRVHRHGIFIRE